MTAPSMMPLVMVPAPMEGVPADDVYAVGGSRAGGLTTDEARTRLRTYGANELQIAQPRPFVVRFAAHFTHLMALLLWAEAFIRSSPVSVSSAWPSCR